MEVIITFGDGNAALKQEWPAIPHKGNIVIIEDGLKLSEYLVENVCWRLHKDGRIKEVSIHVVPDE